MGSLLYSWHHSYFEMDLKVKCQKIALRRNNKNKLDISELQGKNGKISQIKDIYLTI